MARTRRRNRQPAPLALSLKQPWAALVVLGYKTIEIRTWPTAYRGPLLIHASRQSDGRRVPWPLPDTAKQLAELRGGIIGLVELVDCICYRDQERFVLDCALHWNLPEWFRPPQMHGFVFQQPRLVSFLPCSGWFRLFRVPATVLSQINRGDRIRTCDLLVPNQAL